MSAPLKLIDGTVTIPGISFNAESSTGLFRPTAGEVALAVSGVDVIHAKSNGAVLVNGATDTHAAILNIAGKSDLRGDVAVTGRCDITGPATVTGDFAVTGDVSMGSLNGGSIAGFRNRIINGDMRVDQRNNGAVTSVTDYLVDRWASFTVGAGTMSKQRVTSAPPGFSNSLRFTVTSAVTPAAADTYQLVQGVEGYNVADFAFGTASAKAVTASFFVNASIAGTYSLFVYNSTGTRSYFSTYAVISANTWEKKTITIPGDTLGTWATDNTLGFALGFDLGSGSNANSTASVWNNAAFRRTPACVSLISTLNATFAVTGIQLELGTIATPFERRPIGVEQTLCQRYYWRGLPGSNLNYPAFANGAVSVWPVQFPVKQRAVPAVSINSAGATLQFTSAPSVDSATPDGLRLLTIANTVTTNANISFVAGNYIDASSEL